MLYLSLDLETTGLDRQRDQIIMVGAVVEDTEHPEVPVEELPSFVCFVEHDRYEGGAFAFGLNSWIFDILSGRAENKDNIPIYYGTSNRSLYWEGAFHKFLDKYFGSEKIVLAGKNIGSFDYQFLPSELQERFDFRMIDPGSVFICWDMDKPLGLGKLKTKLGIEGKVTHNALEDARDVVRVLRKSYGKTYNEYT